MLQLAAWLLACVLVAYATRRRPLVTVVIALALWIGLPTVAGSLLTGQTTGLAGGHPAALLVLVTLVVQLLHDPGPLLRVVGQRIFLSIAIVSVVLVATATTARRGSGGMALLVDMVVAPLALFLLVLAAVAGRPGAVMRLRTWLIALVAVQAVLTVVQWSAGSILLFEPQHATRWWFDHDFERWMGTTDHPLTLAAMFCIVAPLLVGLRRTWAILALLALFAVGTVITQSRTGVIVLALVAVWVVLRARISASARLASLLALVGGVVVVIVSGLASGLARRFADDTGSADARTDGLAFFAQTWRDYLFVGGGLTSSFRVTDDGGLPTSLEISALMYAVDIGVLFATVYFGAQVILVAQAFTNRSRLPGAHLGALIALVLPQTSSALATRSVVAAILWLALALGVAQAVGTLPAAAASDAPEPDEAAPDGAGPDAAGPEAPGALPEPERDSPRPEAHEAPSGRGLAEPVTAGAGQGAVEVPPSRRTVTAEPSSS